MAAISRSESCSRPVPPDGWWISTRAFGSAMRLPGVPAASSTAAAEAAWPMQTVWMSGFTNCIVS